MFWNIHPAVTSKVESLFMIRGNKKINTILVSHLHQAHDKLRLFKFPLRRVYPDLSGGIKREDKKFVASMN